MRELKKQLADCLKE
ncbi:MAG: hypothetical protein AB9917_17315 [Negativicutes bacterium]